MEEKINKINDKIESKRMEIKLLKNLQLLLETGMLNKDYFEREIKRLISEQNGLVEAYNTLIKED